ncbi:outer membrane beta-barrel protein [Helicobacter typhlonius]|nr:outer membrane beta-barrel protein [Helicobacter typhlonius]CUU39793.1 Hypothetical protein BN2458_PEG0908 [Helicobacter typhlonius]
MFKKSLLLMFVVSALLGNEKNGAFFAIGGGYTPQIPYQVTTPNNNTATSSVPLYTGGIKYGAKHYFNNNLGLRLYLPIQGGFSQFDEGYSPAKARFVSAGMGGDILFDIGSSQSSVGIFAGGEVNYAYYWLDSADSKGIQTQVHFGLALNFTPRFGINIGVRQYINRPAQEKIPFSSSMRDYGGFVNFVFALNNSNISSSAHAQAKARQERETNANANINNSYDRTYSGSSSSGNGFMSGFFGGLVGSVLFGNSGDSSMRTPQNTQPSLKFR